MSIVVGNKACNAKCPYCISKMTSKTEQLPSMFWTINWRNFHIACKLAQKAEATTVLLTGKGEPTLHPNLITQYLTQLGDNKRCYFPFIELQTNGIKLATDESYNEHLKEWYKLGLTTICLSAVHWDIERNKEIYGDYYDLPSLTNKLHSMGFTVRLSIMMLKGYIDNPREIRKVIGFCRTNKIKQLTIRPISRPEGAIDTPQALFVKEHTLNEQDQFDIEKDIAKHATPVLHLAHGATVYDFDGQNICLANCLTTNKNEDDIRQIIFFPDGTISYDWAYKGAVLL